MSKGSLKDQCSETELYLLGLCERVIQAMKIICPAELKLIWGPDEHGRLGEGSGICSFEQGGYRFVYSRRHEISIQDKRKKAFKVILRFGLDGPPYEFHWTEARVRGKVEEVLGRILVLDDLAAIKAED